MSKIPEEMRMAFFGVLPGGVVTSSATGMPNSTYLSQVRLVDDEHFATSYQFFNKTKRNLAENPYAEFMIIHPETTAYWRLLGRYLRTETEGPVFENMAMELEAIASMIGMSEIFFLQGADIFEVLETEQMTKGDAGAAGRVT